MSNEDRKGLGHVHSPSCGCTPPLLSDMIQHAGLELSRRELIKGACVAGGMLAAGGLASAVLAGSTTESAEAGADSIYFGGPILTMTEDGERAEALAVKDGKILAIGEKQPSWPVGVLIQS